MISVVMPALNCVDYIGKAIDSVAGQTLQEPVELLVIDNGSEDGTDLLAEKKRAEWEQTYGEKRRLVLVKNPERGVAGSRNIGMMKASGSYIAFLDADDWWEDTKLEKQMAVLGNDTGCVLCSTGRELVQPDGTPTGRVMGVKSYLTLKDLEKQNWINCSSVVLKTEVAREFLMEHDDSHEDYIMWLRILKKYGYALAVDEPLLKCRQSAGGKSRNKLKSAVMTWKVYRYVGYSFPKALYCFVCYTIAGCRKYYG